MEGMISNIDKLNIFHQTDGILLPIEFSNIPFEVKRIFTINNVPINSIRGNHSHYTTKQYLICLSGRVEVVLNDGKYEETYIIQPNQGIYIPEMIWDYQEYKQIYTEILVLCSTTYDINDYIDDFEKFKQIKDNYDRTDK